MSPIHTQRKSGHILLLVSLLLSLILSIGQQSTAMAQGERKEVLFINSYHPGYKFSDDITRAVTTTLGKEGNINVRVEYLDTKHLDSEAYLDEVHQLFETKYANNQPDLIMSSDDAALNFLFKYADDLFPQVPVIFVGANYFDTARLEGYDRFTGISEETDIAGTIDVALSIHPDTKTIVVVNDTTVTGQKLKANLTELIPQYPQISFKFLEDVTMDEVRQNISNLPSNTLVLLTLFFRDKAGTFYEYDQFTSLVTESSNVPVYAIWDYSLGYGIVGGKLTSGYVEGERAAKVAIRVLNGEDPRSIPVEKQAQSQYLFDANVMQKWGIPESALPKGSTFINRPVSFYEENKTLIWGVLATFIVLVFIVIFLSVNNNQRRKAQAELMLSNRELEDVRTSLELRVADRTKALATSTEVSRRISTIIDQNELVTEVVNQVNNAFGYYHTQMYFYDEATSNLVMAGGTGDASKKMLAQFHKVKKGRGLVGRAAESNQPVLVSDTSQNPEWLPNPLLPDTKAEVAIPVSLGDQLLGVLDVQHNIAGGLQQEDVDTLQSIANQVAVAMQNIRQYERTRKIAADMSVVASVGLATATITEIERLLQEVVDLSKKSFGLYHAHIYLLNEAGDTLELVAGAGEVGKQMVAEKRSISLDHEQSLVARAARIGEGVVVNDVTASPDFLPNPLLPDTRSEMAVPMIIGSKVIGVLDVQSEQAGRFTEVDINIKTTLASQIAIALQNARNLEQSKQQAERESAVNLITQKIQSATKIETALQIAARELGLILGKRQTLVSLDPKALTNPSKAVTNE